MLGSFTQDESEDISKPELELVDGEEHPEVVGWWWVVVGWWWGLSGSVELGLTRAGVAFLDQTFPHLL